MVVAEEPQGTLPNQPTSLPAWLSLTVQALVLHGGPVDPPEDDATIPARAPSAAAWVMVVWATRIRPYEMMPYSSAMRRTTTNANSTISAPRSSRRRDSRFGIHLRLRDPKAILPPLHLGWLKQLLHQFRLHRRCGPCDVILGCHPSSVHRTYGPFGCLTRGAASKNGQKDLCTCSNARRTLQRSDGGEQPGNGSSESSA